MSGMTVHLRGMLLPFEQQLLTARKGVRSRKPAQCGDEFRIDPEVKRRAVVERAARDLLSAAAMTGSDAAVADTTREGGRSSAVVRFFSPAAEAERCETCEMAESVLNRRV